LLEQALQARKQPVGPSCRMDETYVRVKGSWKYLHRNRRFDCRGPRWLLREHI
jgi:transposase-like protein